MFCGSDAIKNAMRDALLLMRDSGFEISGKVEVAVDPDLPFMGYSTQRADSNVIVVAGRAVESGMIEGLLIHEMCHIYRTEKKHPSHNGKLLDSVGLHIIHENQLTEDYQVKLIQEAVNHVQDLYADDIAFRVFEKSGALTREQAFDFFLDWINDTAISIKTVKDKWLNVGIMLNNCFAVSNLKRHNIQDIDNKAENKIQSFLSQTDNSMKKEFTYLRNFMMNLKEDITEKEFEQNLTDYLTRITRLAR